MGQITQTFRVNGTWTAPPGCNSVTATAILPAPGLITAPGPNAAADSAFFLSGTNLYAYGSNIVGELGNGTTTNVSSPTLVIGGYQWLTATFAKNTTALGSANTFGITTTGIAYAWGNNIGGQLGTGTTTAVSSPTLVIGGYTWQKIFTNSSTSFGLTLSGNLYGWGVNTDGQIGSNTHVTVSSPILVIGNLFFKDVQMNQGNGASLSTLGLAWSGKLYGWGQNFGSGVLGINAPTTVVSSPIAVVGNLLFQKFIMEQGGTCVLGLTASGQAYGWGVNTVGQLGNNTVTTVSSPVLVIGGHTFIDIAFATLNAGVDSAYGLTNTGVLYAWGSNTVGQLGIGNTTTVSSPTLVVGGYTWQQVVTITGNSGNDMSVIGLTTSGVLYAWGYNLIGQLGIGTFTNVSSPTLVVGGITWQKILNSGWQWGSAISNGALYTWGFNTFGQLGINTTANVSSPTAVVGGLLGNFVDTPVTITVPVVPNTAYSVIVGPNQAVIGGNTITAGFVDRVILTYQE